MKYFRHNFQIPQEPYYRIMRENAGFNRQNNHEIEITLHVYRPLPVADAMNLCRNCRAVLTDVMTLNNTLFDVMRVCGALRR
jgi:hypothetical protein